MCARDSKALSVCACVFSSLLVWFRTAAAAAASSLHSSTKVAARSNGIMVCVLRIRNASLLLCVYLWFWCVTHTHTQFIGGFPLQNYHLPTCQGNYRSMLYRDSFAYVHTHALTWNALHWMHWADRRTKSTIQTENCYWHTPIISITKAKLKLNAKMKRKKLTRNNARQMNARNKHKEKRKTAQN